jgi:AraC family transcriptional regulator, transcriptional activator of pobA
MIPIHDISEADKKVVKIIELDKKKLNDATEPHRHQYFECFVFLKGGGVHIIDFTEFPIQSNSIHIVTPGQVHQVKRHLNSTGFVFLFELILFDNAKHIESFLFDHTCFDVKEFSPSYHFEKTFASELENIVKQTWKEYNSDNVIKNQLVINQLSLLILYCMRNRIKGTADASTKHLGVYSSFRRLLSSEFKNLKKVKEYASALNITEKQLNEMVLQRTGETASTFINKQIILEAKRLLNTGISAKEVAYELNYTDPAHFSKFFKTLTGISPSDFKNIHD